MQVDLAGRTARLNIPPGALHDALAAALTANGAELVAGERADLLVIAADTAETAADGIRRIAVSDGGRIVLLTAAQALVPLRGDPAGNIGAAGVVSLMRTVAMRLAGEGILVNAVATTGLAAERMRSHASTGLPDAEAIVRAVLFLLDPDSSYLTGHVLVVDGGWSAGFARDF